MYFIVAGSCAVTRLIITFVACFLCVIRERTRDEVDMLPTKPLKGYTGTLIGLGRVFALLVACLEFAYTSVSGDKRVVVLISILCTVLGSFCMTEFLHLLQVFGVIHLAIEKDLGYFMFVIAAAISAVQNLYGSGWYMASTVIPCIILNLFNGVILQCPKCIG
ncbi:hypothetical protein RND81_10G107000 [Saponaria officinalis]|uniref:Uncharacterized protein n=1 Tax=Saponaria officinalis TaxID=3572 RepID=A0AAW1I0N2_SAPOF